MQRLTSRRKQLLAAALSLWVGSTTAFVLFNRYRYGFGDLDGLADLVLISFGVPLAAGSLVLGCWCLGRKGSVYVAIAVAAIGASAAGKSAYDVHRYNAQVESRRQQARQEEDDAIVRRFGKECESQSQDDYSYVICLMEKRSQHRRRGRNSH